MFMRRFYEVIRRLGIQPGGIIDTSYSTQYWDRLSGLLGLELPVGEDDSA